MRALVVTKENIIATNLKTLLEESGIKTFLVTGKNINQLLKKFKAQENLYSYVIIDIFFKELYFDSSKSETVKLLKQFKNARKVIITNLQNSDWIRQENDSVLLVVSQEIIEGTNIIGGGFYKKLIDRLKRKGVIDIVYNSYSVPLNYETFVKRIKDLILSTTSYPNNILITSKAVKRYQIKKIIKNIDKGAMIIEDKNKGYLFDKEKKYFQILQLKEKGYLKMLEKVIKSNYKLSDSKKIKRRTIKMFYFFSHKIKKYFQKKHSLKIRRVCLGMLFAVILPWVFTIFSSLFVFTSVFLLNKNLYILSRSAIKAGEFFNIVSNYSDKLTQVKPIRILYEKKYIFDELNTRGLLIGDSQSKLIELSISFFNAVANKEQTEPITCLENILAYLDALQKNAILMESDMNNKLWIVKQYQRFLYDELAVVNKNEVVMMKTLINNLLEYKNDFFGLENETKYLVVISDPDNLKFYGGEAVGGFLVNVSKGRIVSQQEIDVEELTKDNVTNLITDFKDFSEIALEEIKVKNVEVVIGVEKELFEAIKSSKKINLSFIKRIYQSLKDKKLNVYTSNKIVENTIVDLGIGDNLVKIDCGDLCKEDYLYLRFEGDQKEQNSLVDKLKLNISLEEGSIKKSLYIIGSDIEKVSKILVEIPQDSSVGKYEFLVENELKTQVPQIFPKGDSKIVEFENENISGGDFVILINWENRSASVEDFDNYLMLIKKQSGLKDYVLFSQVDLDNQHIEVTGGDYLLTKDGIYSYNANVSDDINLSVFWKIK